MFRNSSAPDVRYYHKELQDAYDEISNKIVVAISDINNSITSKIAMLVGLDTDKDHFPAIRILDPNPGKSNVLKYYYNQDNIDKDKIIQFVRDFESGVIKAYRKNQEYPASKSNYITALSSNTFEQVVFDKELDVFVMFIGGGLCQLCEEFWPVYVNAATILSRTNGLLFTTINMGLNELDDQTIYYYPTVRYYPKDSKYRPYDYDQGLDLEDVIKFVKRVAAVTPIVEDYAVLLEEKTSEGKNTDQNQVIDEQQDKPAQSAEEVVKKVNPTQEDL
eukprot:403374666